MWNVSDIGYFEQVIGVFYIFKDKIAFVVAAGKIEERGVLWTQQHHGCIRDFGGAAIADGAFNIHFRRILGL